MQKYFDHINQTGEDVIVTDNDIPFIKAHSVEIENRGMWGYLKNYVFKGC